MIVLHCTEKVRRRFGFEMDVGDPGSTSRLGNWYANLLNVGRTRWVLCLNEASLLPVLVPARKAEFPASFPTRLRAVLIGIGVPEGVAGEEVRECRVWTFKQTRNRSVLGSMSDFAFHLKFALQSSGDPTAAALRLADMPCGPLDQVFPDRTALSLLGVEREPIRRFR